ncbi:MAG: cytidine deaminase [Fidelibacterota bacterium]
MAAVVEAALGVRKHARAPYSRYAVGAAVETGDGTIVSGCNVESSSFGLTICAERVALGSAVAHGYRSFKSMAVASEDGAAPCGACRQVIWDLCRDIPIVLIDGTGKKTTVRSSELLPRPFDDHNLPKFPSKG